MNIFEIPADLHDEEIVEIISSKGSFRIERIISTGQVSPPGFWFDQDEDEWVVLLQGEAKIEWDDEQVKVFKAGDSIFIPAHERHRVVFASTEPPCIWLAVFF